MTDCPICGEPVARPRTLLAHVYERHLRRTPHAQHVLAYGDCWCGCYCPNWPVFEALMRK